MDLCRHKWNFPRRSSFGVLRNVDIQSCRECGKERLSKVQFGGSSLEASEPRELQAPVNFNEGEVNA